MNRGEEEQEQELDLEQTEFKLSNLWGVVDFTPGDPYFCCE